MHVLQLNIFNISLLINIKNENSFGLSFNMVNIDQTQFE